MAGEGGGGLLIRFKTSSNAFRESTIQEGSKNSSGISSTDWISYDIVAYSIF